MSPGRRRLVAVGLVVLAVSTVAIAYVRGTRVAATPFDPTQPDQGVRCQVVAWPGGAEGETAVRCAAVFERSVDSLWGPLTDYAKLPQAFDSVFYRFDIETLEGVAPGPVTLKGAVVFWLMRFPLDLVLEHTAEGGVRTVRWDAADERFATRGGWRLEALAPDRTRVEYMLDARVAYLPDFVVKVVLRDNLPRVLRALGGVAAP
ncbi:MAG: hypothetical protein KC583_17030 [Myxococcales bacterium]|nr:hypothetical protein [Myxococcales bacterium]